MLLVASFATTSQADKRSSSSLLKSAVTLRETGQNQQAVDILEQLKTDYNDHKRVNIELVINYIKLEQYLQAEGILEHLNKLDLSPEEKKKLASLKKHIKKNTISKLRKHYYSFELSSYAGVDSFTSQFPVYEFSYYDDLSGYDDFSGYDENFSVSRSDQTQKQKDSYFAEQFRAVYRYKPNYQFQLFRSPTLFFWSNDFSVYQKRVDNQTNSRYGQVKLDSSFTLLKSNRWMFDMKLRGRYHYNKGDKVLSEQGLILSTALPVGKGRIKLGWEYRTKKFDRVSNRVNNADVSIPSVEYGIKFFDHYRFYLGARYRRNDAIDAFYTYDNLNYYSSLHYFTGESFSAFISLNDNQLEYLIDDPAIVNWGEESKYSIALGTKYRFNRHFSIGANAHFVTKNIDLNFDAANTKDRWNRLEVYFSYRF